MNLLAFDCSMPQASIAILNKNKLLLEKNWEHQDSPHSSKLLIEIHSALKKLHLSLSDLSALAVGAGPGRFTGIRTALCTAKAFSYSLKIPIYPVNTLKALAESFLAGGSYQQALIQNKVKALCLAIHAFKKQVYWAPFDQKPQLLTFEDWKSQIKELPNQTLCLSDMQDFYDLKEKNVLFVKPKLSAFSLAKIALKSSPKSWEQLKPEYLRDF